MRMRTFSLFSKPRIDLYELVIIANDDFVDAIFPSSPLDKHRFRLTKVNKTIFIEMTSTNIQIFVIWQLGENKIIIMMIH